MSALAVRFHERMTMRTLERVGLILSVCLAACSGGGDGTSPDAAPPDAPPPDANIPDAMPIPDASQMPESLRETGLYSDFENEILAPGVREFTPTFELWSDGAVKKRWMYLPPGTQIDTSDMDFWEYPVGTRLWKEFRRDGVRVETRLLYKIRPGIGVSSWRMLAFAWNADQTDAVAARGGAIDTLGTGHDIPSEIECLKCHGGMPDVALGFSAVMLDHTGAGVTLDDLIAAGDLSHPPVGAGAPYFPLPGSAAEQGALGYLHANCGGCHNPRSEVFLAGDALMNLRLMVGQIATVQGSPAYTTTVCQDMQKPIVGADQIIVPGTPETSAMFLRMNQRNTDDQMPQLGTELIDTTGLETVRAWIASISGCP
jgi:hypothetical protein